MRRWRAGEIERRAERRVQELGSILGSVIGPPVPVDLVAEQVLGLNILWESIEELPGEVILGGLIPERRLIVLNDRHQELFRAKPGLERFTKGHEMGHWDLFVDPATLDQPGLPGFGRDGWIVPRSSPAGRVAVPSWLVFDPDAVRLLVAIERRADDPMEARAVNRYAAALMMPAAMVREAALQVDRTQWRPLYGLAERFEVTITALRVRLEQLGLLYVDRLGKLYESRGAAGGQLRLL